MTIEIERLIFIHSPKNNINININKEGTYSLMFPSDSPA